MMERIEPADGSRPSGDDAVTVHVPLSFRQRGGRKAIVGPDGVAWVPHQALPMSEDPLVRALAKAFRWQATLDAGRYATIHDLAAAEKVNASYLSRVLRLTLVEPAVVDALLDGGAP